MENTYNVIVGIQLILLIAVAISGFLGMLNRNPNILLWASVYAIILVCVCFASVGIAPSPKLARADTFIGFGMAVASATLICQMVLYEQEERAA